MNDDPLQALESKREDDAIVFSFDLSDSRHQSVYVKLFSESEDGLHRFAFLSPCQKLGTGFLSGISKAKAVELLRHNATLPTGHFCLLRMGGQELLCVRSVRALEHLSVQEFKTHCRQICTLADDWEQQLGRDDFWAQPDLSEHVEHRLHEAEQAPATR